MALAQVQKAQLAGSQVLTTAKGNIPEEEYGRAKLPVSCGITEVRRQQEGVRNPSRDTHTPTDP